MRYAMLALYAGLVTFILIVSLAVQYRPVPECEEDQVLVGAGSFDHGRWSGYVCGPAADDYMGG